VPELVQKGEGKGEGDEIEDGLVLIVSQAVAVGGRLGDVRRPGNVRGLLGCNERLGAGDALLVVEFVLPPFGVDAPSRPSWGRRSSDQ